MAEASPPVLLPWLPEPHRVAVMYAAMFFVTGVTTPFLPVWFESRGLSASEIGFLSILPQVVRSALAPAVGFAADRNRAHRQMAIGLGALGVLAWLLLAGTSGLIFAAVGMTLIAISNTMAPLVECIALAGVRDHGHDYGRMRFWGSAAFVAANLLGGFFASHYGTSAVIVLMCAGAAATFAVSFLLPQPLVLSAAQQPRQPLSWAGAQALFHIPKMPMLLLAAGAVQGAHGMFYAYGTLHWQAQGLNPSWFGALWAVGLVTEVALFWWSKEAVRRLGAAELIIAGAALSVIRWTLMAFDPPLGLLVPLQLLHGLTFGASHLGAMHVLAKIVQPDRSATAQALYSLVSTVGVVIATGIAARLYPGVGGQAYLVMAAMALIGLIAAIQIRRQVSATTEPA